MKKSAYNAETSNSLDSEGWERVLSKEKRGRKSNHSVSDSNIISIEEMINSSDLPLPTING